MTKDKMTKEDFKKSVISWLLENGVDLSKRKIRVYDSKKYGLEVRIYNKPLQIENSRKSFRETSRDENGRHGTYGTHTRTITTYIHINQEDIKNENEKLFILETLDYN